MIRLYRLWFEGSRLENRVIALSLKQDQTMIYFVRGLKTLLPPIYLLAFVLLIAGCSDSAILEVELPVPDEEQIELIPPSANPEPPELVARYIELQMEIESKHGKQAEIDTAAVIEGIMLANELATYNGPMARVFQFIDAGIEATEADSAGQSIEEIRDKLNQKIGNSHCPTCNPCPTCKSFADCSQNCDDTKQSDDMWTGAWAVGETVTCGGSAAVAAIKRPSKGALIGIGVAKVGCIGTTLWDAYQGMKTNENNHELCVRRCRDHFPKPT